MDLSLTELQQLLQNQAREFLDAELPKARVLEIDESEKGFDADLWQKISELGWPAMVIPEEYGGSGNSWTDLGVVYEVLGQYACPSPHLSSSVICAQLILNAANDEQKHSILPGIASGEQIYAFAYTEASYGWAPSNVTLSAKSNGDGYVLNGTKLFVHDANVADKLIVAARTEISSNSEDGIGLFIVDANDAGVSIRTQTGWIGPKVAEVIINNVKVNSSDVLGSPGNAWPAIETAMDCGTAMLNLYMAGGTQRVYEMARDYSQERMAFGVPIGTFQRVQDHVIDALNAADAGKWTGFEAASYLDEGIPDYKNAISLSKSVVSDGFPLACDASHHVHAGIGADLNYGLTQYTKRARTLQHYLGDSIYHRKRMASLLIKK
jgi:acyl-CoA dehydrogenase